MNLFFSKIGGINGTVGDCFADFRNIHTCGLHDIRQFHLQLARRTVQNIQDDVNPDDVRGEPLFVPLHNLVSDLPGRFHRQFSLHVQIRTLLFPLHHSVHHVRNWTAFHIPDYFQVSKFVKGAETKIRNFYKFFPVASEICGMETGYRIGFRIQFHVVFQTLIRSCL